MGSNLGHLKDHEPGRSHHLQSGGHPQSSGDPIHIEHPGRLHGRLGIPQGQPIPESRIRSAEHSSDPSLRREAQFADNAKKFHHG